MTVTAFPIGQTLTSTALTQNQFNLILQSLACQMLGINTGFLVSSALAVKSPTITVADPSNIAIGQAVIGQGISQGTTVIGALGATITLSTNALATAAAALLNFGADTNAFSAVRTAWPQDGQPAWSITDDICIIAASLDDDDYDRVRNVIRRNNDAQSVQMADTYTRVWKATLTLYGPNSFDRARVIRSAVMLDWAHDVLAENALYLIPDIATPSRAPENFSGQWWDRSDIRLRCNEQVTETLILNSIAATEVIGETAAGIKFDITA